MRYLLKCALSIIFLLTGQYIYSQGSFQQKIDEAYTTYMCECLNKYSGEEADKLDEIFRTKCLDGFNEDRWLPMLEKAALAREVEIPSTKEEYRKFERDILTNVRMNTVVPLLDNCPIYKKGLTALRETTATDFNKEFDIQGKYDAKSVRESLTYQTKREQSISLMSLGTIYQQRKDYSRAMSFYRESYDVMPRYKVKGFIHLLSAIPYDKDSPAPVKKTSKAPKRDVKDIKKEVEEAFIKHHCECLSKYADRPIEELLNAYRNTCYEDFLPGQYRSMTKGVFDSENPEKKLLDIRKDLFVVVLSSTAGQLVDECEAYRKVLEHTKVLLKDKVEEVQSTVSRDPIMLRRQIASYSKDIQSNVFKLLGLHEENQGNLKKAIKYYYDAYNMDSKSQLLAYVRLAERKIAGKDQK